MKHSTSRNLLFSRRDSADHLIENICGNVERLLSIRSHTYQHYTNVSKKENENTVIDYGIPDFSFASTHSNFDKEMIRQSIIMKIIEYEPRLEEVTIEFDEKHINISSELHFIIYAKVKIKDETRHVELRSQFNQANHTFLTNEMQS